MVTCYGEDFASRYIDDGTLQVRAVFSKLRRMAKNPVNKNKKALFLCINNAGVLLDNENQIKVGMGSTRTSLFCEMNRIKEDNKSNNPKIILFMKTSTEKDKK